MAMAMAMASVLAPGLAMGLVMRRCKCHCRSRHPIGKSGRHCSRRSSLLPSHRHCNPDPRRRTGSRTRRSRCSTPSCKPNQTARRPRWMRRRKQRQAWELAPRPSIRRRKMARRKIPREPRRRRVQTNPFRKPQSQSSCRGTFPPRRSLGPRFRRRSHSRRWR